MTDDRCEDLPADEIEGIVERTRETVKEHGFVWCRSVISGDRYAGRVAEGSDREVNLDKPFFCRNPVNIHTHPDELLSEPSAQDKRLVLEGRYDEVCVVNEDGDVECYDGDGKNEQCEIDL